MEDASLDRFADAAAGADESGDRTDDADVATTADEGADAPPAVEPARSTAAWTPAGAACEACGASAERRWTTDDGLVCVDCVDW